MKKDHKIQNENSISNDYIRQNNTKEVKIKTQNKPGLI